MQKQNIVIQHLDFNGNFYDIFLNIFIMFRYTLKSINTSLVDLDYTIYISIKNNKLFNLQKLNQLFLYLLAFRFFQYFFVFLKKRNVYCQFIKMNTGNNNN